MLNAFCRVAPSVRLSFLAIALSALTLFGHRFHRADVKCCPGADFSRLHVTLRRVRRRVRDRDSYTIGVCLVW